MGAGDRMWRERERGIGRRNEQRAFRNSIELLFHYTNICKTMHKINLMKIRKVEVKISIMYMYK